MKMGQLGEYKKIAISYDCLVVGFLNKIEKKKQKNNYILQAQK